MKKGIFIGLVAISILPGTIWSQALLPPFQLRTESTIQNGVQAFRFWAADALGNPWDPQLVEGDTTPYCRVMLAFGDGNYYIINGLENLDTVNYVYKTQGQYNAYMEAAAIYDRDKKKTSFSYAVVNVTSPTTNGTVFIDGMTDTMAITTIREARVGEIMTYILSYKNQGNLAPSGRIRVLYSPYLFRLPVPITEPNNVDNYYGENIDYSGSAISGFEDTLYLEYSGLARGARRDFILHFIPREFDADSKSQSKFPDSICIRAALINDAGQEIDQTYSCNAIVESHDPNTKSGFLFYSTPMKAEYKIVFQNTGDGPPAKVEIRDELNLAFDVSGINDLTINTDPRLGPATATLVPVGEANGALVRELRLKFEALQEPILGTGNPNFGHAYGVDATTRTITIVGRLKSGFLDSCDAVANSARIYFDAHPPVETDVASLPVWKYCPGGYCQFSETIIDRRVELQPNTSPFPLVPPGTVVYQQIERLHRLGYKFRWYPASLVADPAAFNTLATTKHAARFALVATNSGCCEANVFYINLAAKCPFEIAAPDTVVVNCANSQTGQITVRPAGAFQGQNALVWSTGAPGNAPVQLGPLAPGVHTIALTNTQSQCAVEKSIHVVAPPRILVDDVPGNPTVDLFVSGGTPPYSYNWLNTPGAVPNTTFSNVPFVEGMSVVVTDSKGCQATFHPKQSN